MGNINDIYFNGHYKEIWRSVIPGELTTKEVDFMLTYFKLKPGHSVLDLMCGYGRHSLALARSGINVSALDNLGYYVKEVAEFAEKEKLPIKAIEQDILAFNPTEIFDLVICMGNSLNFFNSEDSMRIFRMISSCLKKGGHLLINTWSLMEIVAKSISEKTWSTNGGVKCLFDSKVLFQPARIETDTTMIDSEGKTENKFAIDYIYSLNEIEFMFANAELVLKEVFSIPGKKKFSIGDPRAYIVADK